LAGLGNYYLYEGTNSTSRNFEKWKELVKEAWSWDYRHDNSYVWKAYGYLYHIEGDTKRAEANYEKAIELDPNNPYPYNNLGVIYHNHYKNYELAEKYFLKAYELDPTYELVIRNLYNTYLNMGDEKRADEFLENATEKLDDKPED